MGGLSDGGRGIAVMEYIRDGLRARKAWFLLDRAVVCLGTGIDDEAPEAVLTSVNQCALNGPVTICGTEQPRKLAKEERFSGALQWVHHDRIGYVFAGPTTVTVTAQTQRGDWHRVHSRDSTRTVEREVFSLWIDHGSKPHDARYAYIVFPDVEVSAMSSLRSSSAITVLQQTAAIVAISGHEGKLIQAVFFEPGRLAWGDGLSLAVESPCVVAFDNTADATRLHVSDPTHTRRAMKLSLAGKYLGRGAQYDGNRRQTELTVSLPQEGDAGRTVSLELQPSRL